MSAIIFNADELSTWNQAEHYAGQINRSEVFLQAGIQVASKDGIYLPSWEGGPGGFQEPQIGNSKWFHYRFSNGMSGMNCGLVRGMFQRYPNSPLYVLTQLLAEVQQGAPKS